MANRRNNSVTVNVKASGRARVIVNVAPQTEAPKLLKFGKGNAKLPANVRTFSLPAGWSCPFADKCLSRTNRETGKISDGPNTEFRCFAASDEQIRPTVRKARWHNFNLLRGKSSANMARLILASLRPDAECVRVHVSGDFFSQAYFDAWMEVARERPRTRFYAYTKAIPLWVNRIGTIPANVVLTASIGGTHDHLIEANGLRSARVVLSQDEADALGLPIDHDDSHAMVHGPSFALLIHGMQPAGSDASRAIARLRKEGEFGYGKRADAIRAQRTELPIV